MIIIYKYLSKYNITSNLKYTFLLYCFLFFLFYLPPRSKFWIELLDLSDSLKYFIPSEPILLSIPNIYSKKKKLDCKIGNEGLKKLAQLLKSNNSIQTLNLRGK